ncbi:hypothetical protein YC2023_014745 [Brassica napus]
MGLSNELSVERDRLIRITTQPKAYPLAAWIPILVTTAEPQKQPNQVQNWINVLDHLFHLIDKFTAIRALLVLNKKILDIQLLELASRHGTCLEDVILRAAQMKQIVEKVCEERLNTGAVCDLWDYFPSIRVTCQLYKVKETTRPLFPRATFLHHLEIIVLLLLLLNIQKATKSFSCKPE